MKAVTVPMARLRDWPDLKKLDLTRCAFRAMSGSWDYLVQQWSNRAAMLQACVMSEDARYSWKPVLKDCEIQKT